MPGYRSDGTNNTIDLSAQNAIFGPIRLKGTSKPEFSAQTGAANPALSTFVVEGRIVGSWITMELNQSSGATTNIMTGPDVLATVPRDSLGAISEIRARRTDALGGAATFAFAVSS